MKTGWQTTTLGSVAQIGAGNSAPQKKELFTDGTHPFFRTSDAGRVRFGDIFESSDYLNDEGIKGLRRFPKGTILFPKSGASTFLNHRVMLGVEGFVSSHLATVVGDEEKVDRRFLLYFLTTIEAQDLIQDHAYPTLNLPAIAGIPVHLPALPEQQRIVGILDAAFDGIATAKANAEKNLQNARALFESHLQSVFTQAPLSGVEGRGENEITAPIERSQRPSPKPQTTGDAEVLGEKVTKTGGREATTRHIPGDLALAVGMPSTDSRKGWRWSLLSNLARLESGHTPSRRHPEYWGGSIPWIGIQDAREHHGLQISHTYQTTNELGIANSSARVLPANTVCLSRTASVGYVVVMGRPMATSQDFVNWICSEALLPEFLKYIFLAEGREGLLRYASGSVHQTIYFPEAKAFHICYPEIAEQRRIVQQCDALREETQRLASLYQRKLAALDELKKSLLHQAFTGEL